MIVTSRQGAYRPGVDPGLPALRRRLSQALFGFFQSALSASNGQHDLADAAPPRAALELADHPAAQDLVDALILRRQLGLPSELTIVPDRVSRTSCLQAAGFSDCRSASVGVDVAIWSQPCSDMLDVIAWRRVFTWVVSSDRRLTNVSIIDPPSWAGEALAGSYGYEADGIPGYGVLQVRPAADGSWRIFDCWGDAEESPRVDELAGNISAG